MVFTQLRWVFLWCRWWSNLNRVYKVWWCLNPKKCLCNTGGKTNSLSKILMITTCFVKFSKLVFKFCLQWKEHSHQYLVIYSDHLVSSFQSDLWQQTPNAPDNLAKFCITRCCFRQWVWPILLRYLMSISYCLAMRLMDKSAANIFIKEKWNWKERKQSQQLHTTFDLCRRELCPVKVKVWKTWRACFPWTI